MSAPDASAPAYPIPVPDADTQPFWDGCQRRELWIQRCGPCQAWLWQPRPVCSRCQTPDPTWTRVSGAGRVVSWITLHPPVLPSHAGQVPFSVLLVELREGPRLLGYRVDDAGNPVSGKGASEGLRVGVPVSLRFHDQAGTLLPSWTLTP